MLISRLRVFRLRRKDLIFSFRKNLGEFLSKGAYMISLEPETFSWIALITALGVGSIIAAVVGWWSAKAVAISNHRQNWINELRDDMVNYLKAVDAVHWRLGMLENSQDRGDEGLEKLHEVRGAALLAYRRILLRLNMTEPASVDVARRLEKLLVVSKKVADQDDIGEAVFACRVVLRQEWAVTKYGVFTRPITLLKDGCGALSRWVRGCVARFRH